MDTAKSFNETIKELEEELNESLDSLVDSNVKYRSAQDKIDQLNNKIFETKVQILELVYSLNDLLPNFDLSRHKFVIEDLKKLNNAEALRLVNNLIHLLTSKY